MDKNKQAQYMIRRIGGTTYKVRVAFSESGKETQEDKILRMKSNEIVKKHGKIFINCLTQKIRQSERSAS